MAILINQAFKTFSTSKITLQPLLQFSKLQKGWWKIPVLNEVRLNSKELTKQSGKAMPIPTLLLLLFYFWLGSQNDPQNSSVCLKIHSIIGWRRKTPYSCSNDKENKNIFRKQYKLIWKINSVLLHWSWVIPLLSPCIYEVTTFAAKSLLKVLTRVYKTQP